MVLKGSFFKLFVVLNGLIVGVVEEVDFEVVIVKLEFGDMIFLYIDGLLEVYNFEYVVFEIEWIESFFNSL